MAYGRGLTISTLVDGRLHNVWYHKKNGILWCMVNHDHVPRGTIDFMVAIFRGTIMVP